MHQPSTDHDPTGHQASWISADQALRHDDSDSKFVAVSLFQTLGASRRPNSPDQIDWKERRRMLRLLEAQKRLERAAQDALALR